MNEIIKIIETDGLAIVISALVVYGAAQTMNIFLDRLREKTIEKTHVELLEVRRRINIEINTMLERVMYKTNASRAYVFEFHNGLTGLGGLPFLKMSNTYEVCQGGISCHQRNLENMPCNLYSAFLHEIEINDYVLLDVNNRIDRIPNHTYELLVEQDVEKTLVVKLMNSKKMQIGFIGLDYCVCKDEYKEEHIEILEDLAKEIGALLSVK